MGRILPLLIFPPVFPSRFCDILPGSIQYAVDSPFVTRCLNFPRSTPPSDRCPKPENPLLPAGFRGPLRSKGDLSSKQHPPNPTFPLFSPSPLPLTTLKGIPSPGPAPFQVFFTSFPPFVLKPPPVKVSPRSSGVGFPRYNPGGLVEYAACFLASLSRQGWGCAFFLFGQIFLWQGFFLLS